MNDKTLTEALRRCSKGKDSCQWCPAYDECIWDGGEGVLRRAAERLKAFNEENEKLREQLTLRNDELLKLRERLQQWEKFHLGKDDHAPHRDDHAAAMWYMSKACQRCGRRMRGGGGAVFELPPNPDGRPILRYDGILAGAFGQLLCVGCQRQLYAGTCRAPSFLAGEQNRTIKNEKEKKNEQR